MRPKVLTAVPVAYTRAGEVDLDASRQIVAFVADHARDDAFVLGTTAEFVALSRAERRDLAGLSLEILGPDRTIVHVGAASARDVRALIADARELGARRVAVLTPYYVALTDELVVDFYRDVLAAAEGLPVYAYLFSARTGYTMSPAVLARLAELGVVGAKVSGQPIEVVGAYRPAVPEGFELLTGTDAHLAVVRDHGVAGVVSGVASAFPEPFRLLADAVEAQDLAAIDDAQSRVDDVVGLIRGNVARIKEVLRIRGIDAGYCRVPFEEPSPDVVAELRRAVAAYS